MNLIQEPPVYVTAGLVIVILCVFILPFLIKKVEHNLELFLFIMGALSLTISSLWNKHIIIEALTTPVSLKHPIVEVVFFAALIFKVFRNIIHSNINKLKNIIGIKWFIFGVIVILGLFSSIITAIIASLVLVEIISGLKLNRKTEINLTIISCFSIGLGAAITPIGEPLSTILVAKLSGEPYNANFFFLINNIGKFIIPGIIALGIFGMFFLKSTEDKNNSLSQEEKPETFYNILERTIKVYLFIMALVLLGEGFKPIIDTYIIKLHYKILYWMNMVSAILDNATLTAAEISPSMSIQQINSILMGLLISGGMLIPGNIPNIISASKLKISSTEWAKLGVPLGLVLMIVYFVLLLIL